MSSQDDAPVDTSVSAASATVDPEPLPAAVVAEPAAPVVESWETFVENFWMDHVHGTVLAGQTPIWNYMQDLKSKLISRLNAKGG